MTEYKYAYTTEGTDMMMSVTLVVLYRTQQGEHTTQNTKNES